MSDRAFRSAACLALVLAGCTAAPEGGDRGPKCKISPPATRQACTTQYAPVCGCDGKTYPNACVARASGVSRSRPGACADATQE